jgi:transcriptional regulator with XRE-family HTH domain
MDMETGPGFASLAGRIRFARVNAGLNQIELASLCDVSPSLICVLESGRIKSLRHSTLIRMAKVLGRSPEWLALGQGKEKPIPARLKFEQKFMAELRKLSAAEKKDVLRLVQSMVDQKADRS